MSVAENSPDNLRILAERFAEVFRAGRHEGGMNYEGLRERAAKLLEDAAQIERAMASGGDESEPGWYAADRFLQLAKQIRELK